MSPVPNNPQEILAEASVIAITTTPPTTPSPTVEEQQEIIERYLSFYLGS